MSYTIRTVAEVRKTIGKDDSLYFLIGSDAFAEIETWHRAEDLLAMVDFIVVSRPGHRYAKPQGARIHPLETVILPVSSSEIRQNLAEGKVPKDLPPAVFEYIRANGLYNYGKGLASPALRAK